MERMYLHTTYTYMYVHAMYLRNLGLFESPIVIRLVLATL